MAKKVTNVDYRLLIASAYSGFLIWHGGISGSTPLTIATEGHFSQDLIGIIPTSETIFSSFNLFIVIALLVIVPLVNRSMMPSKDQTVTVDPALLQDDVQAVTLEKASLTPAERLENSRIISLAIGLLGLAFLFYYFVHNGFKLNLDIVNFLFLFLEDIPLQVVLRNIF